MWKAPNKYRFWIGGKWVVRAEISHPLKTKDPFARCFGTEIFSNGEALKMGFKPIRRVNYDTTHYKDGGWEDIDNPTEIVRQPISISPRYTVGELKIRFNENLKTTGRQSLINARSWINYYTEFEPASGKLAEWQSYIADIKAAYSTIRAEVHPTITDYDILVEYIKCEPDPKINGWRKYIPEQPE